MDLIPSAEHSRKNTLSNEDFELKRKISYISECKSVVSIISDYNCSLIAKKIKNCYDTNINFINYNLLIKDRGDFYKKLSELTIVDNTLLYGDNDTNNENFDFSFMGEKIESVVGRLIRILKEKNYNVKYDKDNRIIHIEW
jgi:hypothetical protein